MNWGNFWKTIHHISVAAGAYAAAVPTGIPYAGPVAALVGFVASVIAHATQ